MNNTKQLSRIKLHAISAMAIAISVGLQPAAWSQGVTAGGKCEVNLDSTDARYGECFTEGASPCGATTVPGTCQSTQRHACYCLDSHGGRIYSGDPSTNPPVRTLALSPAASPSSATAGETYVNLTASGMPSGTINPNNVVITVAATCGGTTLASTTAASVKPILGDIDRISLLVPASLPQGNNQTLYFSLYDIIDAIPFNSSNCAKVLVNQPIPPAVCNNGYNISSIATDGDSRGDGFTFQNVGAPATDGSTVFFDDSQTSLWAASISGSGYIKLADTSTAVPGGTGNFTRFGEIQVNAGILVFPGTDSAGNTGLYSQPTGGGPISLVADHNTPDPSGGQFRFNSNPSFGIDPSGTIAVGAANDQFIEGVYKKLLGQGQFTTVMDGNHPCLDPGTGTNTVTNFTATSIYGSNVAVLGNDPGNGFNALYVKNCTVKLADSNTSLPGDPNTTSVNVIGDIGMYLDSVYASLLDRNTLGTANPFAEIVRLGTGGDSQKVVDSNTTLTGLISVNGANSFQKISVGPGAVAYKATDSSNNSSIYLNQERVYGNNNTVVLRGGSVDIFTFVDDLTRKALAPNGAVAFRGFLTIKQKKGNFVWSCSRYVP